MLKGFRDFIMRGNVVDLAVAVIIGGAFNSIVQALVKDIITPFIGVFGGVPDFSGLKLNINSSLFLVGDFINQLISFIIMASVIYFAIVMPMNKIMVRINKGEKIDPKTKSCPECLSIVPLQAKRCKFCTSVIREK